MAALIALSKPELEHRGKRFVRSKIRPMIPGQNACANHCQISIHLSDNSSTADSRAGM
jgi:hypothetical protein